MNELEISKTLPQLTRKQAFTRTEQNKMIGRLGPISLYLHVIQGGLEIEGTTLPKYCASVYGIEVRAAQYWLTRVKAMMILNRMTDENLLQLWTGDRKELPEIPPQDVSAEVVKNDPETSILAWERFQAIRDEPTLSTQGNATSFKRLLTHGNSSVGVHSMHPSRDQNEAKTTKNATATERPGMAQKTFVNKTEPEANTVNSGPWCACGDVCKEGDKMCWVCMTDAVSADPMPEVGTLRFDLERNAYVDEDGNDAGKPEPPNEEIFCAHPEVLRSITELTVCSAENHSFEGFWLIRLTDCNGTEYVANIPQAQLDASPIK